MSLVFNAGTSCPSPISDDYCMEENRLSSLEGLPQASWQAGCYLDHVVQRSEIFPEWFSEFNDSSSVLADEFPPLAPGNYAYNWSRGVVDDSGRLKKTVEPQYGLLEDVAAAGLDPAIVAVDRSLSNFSTDDSDSYGDSESLQKQDQGFSPPSGGELCNRFRDLGVRKLDGSPENGIIISAVLEETKNPWQESGTTPQFCKIEGRGESKPRCGPSAGPDDLLSSLRSLLSVLKNHVEQDQVLRTKMQKLRKRKEDLHLQKQQYQNEHKRQRALDR